MLERGDESDRRVDQAEMRLGEFRVENWGKEVEKGPGA